MTVGMAMNAGHADEKRAKLLTDAAQLADSVGLWVIGQPASTLLRQIAGQVRESEGGRK